ncbi:hypothetical protein RBU49_03080 [Clostridium sp. MB40-C1]|uniref:phage terminase large subunit family protein n=1 Tax=Clostridium sp. MB40-C1 TaxID=3070996 RepID=UPI0027E09E69|nr:terminase family protein [Clostridium sp. MB40-C1]WMJ81254.1 hypothetical protein RBU49_03080 [Clostridium sp. MB40-C1]
MLNIFRKDSAEWKLYKVMNDKTLWIENFVKIANKEGKIVPFKLNPMQRIIIKDRKHRKKIILKSRQVGMSVVSCAKSLYYCTESNTECLLVSYSIDSATAIFEKLKQMYYSLPEAIRPKLVNNNKKELKFTNGSRIVVATAGNKQLARGMTLKYCHLSEFAFWKDNANKQLLAIEQALRPDGEIDIESTANGLNWFNEKYFKAKNHENSYFAYFFNYIQGACMFKREMDESVKTYVALNDTELTYDMLEDEEKDLINYYGADLRIIMWRRLKIADSSIEEFNQEFPITDNVAFVSTGNAMFDSKRLAEVEMAIIKNKNLVVSKSKIKNIKELSSLIGYYNKEFKIYKLREKGMRYHIGIDAGDGVGKDYTVVTVLDKNFNECAMFRSNKLKPYAMAEIINAIGRYYNKALLEIERASGGRNIIEKLETIYKYKRISMSLFYDEFNIANWRAGFDTHSKSKEMIIRTLVEFFDTNKLCVNSRETIEEMKIFVQNANGSMRAMGEGHDDTVISLALSLNAIINGAWVKW